MNLKAGINLALISMLRANHSSPLQAHLEQFSCGLQENLLIHHVRPGCVSAQGNAWIGSRNRESAWQIVLLCRNREPVQQGRKGDSQDFGGVSPVPVAWTHPQYQTAFFFLNTEESLR